MRTLKRLLEGNIRRTAHARRPGLELPNGSLGRTYVRNEGLRSLGGSFQQKLPHWRNDKLRLIAGILFILGRGEVFTRLERAAEWATAGIMV